MANSYENTIKKYEEELEGWKGAIRGYKELLVQKDKKIKILEREIQQLLGVILAIHNNTNEVLKTAKEKEKTNET